MKRIAFVISACLVHLFSLGQEKNTTDSFYLLSPVEVRAVRADDQAPFVKTNLSKKDFQKNNLGQDIPFLLNQTPSVVINSDAGNGFGYTGIRIRGTDATRINVTLNGIPYNDAESQGTFFVDLPDFSSSTGSVQIQRGVGASSNGAGAFGGSINFSTNEVNKKAYAEFNNSYGSFNSFKSTLKGGTGLLSDHFTFDARLSALGSDGFIDRASSKLRSLYFSSAWINTHASLRFNIFSGKEKTYQAWYGISQQDLDAGNRRINYAGTEKPGAPYDNETDNYTQTHYQLFYNQDIGKKIKFNTALFMTTGEGYYEQYKANEDYADYNMPNPPAVTSSDMIRQLWLNNDLMGSVFSLHHKNKKTTATFGGAYSHYRGLHYGKVIWAEKGLTSTGKWYDLGALKKDLNLYAKQQWTLGTFWNLYYDLQYRHVDYDIGGFRNNPTLLVRTNYDFFNPKIGISFLQNGWRSFASFSIANKEPNRDDFEAGAAQQPKPERLYDTETGFGYTTENYNWSVSFYFMNYKDQLVLTGRINDVGAYTRTNIPKSFHAGVEMEGGYRFSKKINAAANLSISKNKVRDFTEYIDDYDNGGQKTKTYGRTDIAFSPSVVAGATIDFVPLENLDISLLNKYVSRQFLDNTQDKNRSLEGYHVHDLRISYLVKTKQVKEITLIAHVNNLFSEKYQPNGYTYNYIYNGELSVNNYYFPMAGINFMLGLNLKW